MYFSLHFSIALRNFALEKRFALMEDRIYTSNLLKASCFPTLLFFCFCFFLHFNNRKKKIGEIIAVENPHENAIAYEEREKTKHFGV